MKYHRGEPLRHVGDVPTMAAERYRDKLAVEYRGEEYSYADLEARANQVANALVDQGVEPGDRVALYLENSLQFPESLFGAIKAGAVPVPLNHRMDVDRLTYILDDAGAVALVGSDVFPSVVADLSEHVPTTLFPGGGDGYVDYDAAVDAASDAFDAVDRDFSDPALQCYTSGTTGDPKGVLTSHENVLTTVNSYHRRSGVDPETDVSLVVLPLFHMYGLVAAMLTNLYGGGTVVLKTLPVPAALLQAITEHEVTSFAGIPAIFIEMVREYESNPEAYDLSSIELVGSGAAPLADDTRRRVEAVFDTRLVEGWGMTETTPAGTTSSSYGVSKGAGCIGQPLPDVELRLVDPETREVRVGEALLDPTSASEVGEELDFSSAERSSAGRSSGAGVEQRDDPRGERGAERPASGQSPREDEENVTGEIAIRGPQVFEGYHGMPEKTAEVFDDGEPRSGSERSNAERSEARDGRWFYTGDIARVDEDGFLWMVDRADDMIIVGGENVYPAEVENALFDHPDVQAAAVVAADHRVKGEAPVAYVVPEPGADLDPEEVRRFALDHVASYAHPREVFVVDELPRSGTQKVQRYKLEDDAADRLGGPLEPSETL